jgi:acyl dehydratase
MKFFEDISVGERRRIGSHLFAAEEIKRFAQAFDPQPFHLDEAQAERSHFGRLCASGWHTLAIWMKLNVREMQLAHAKDGAGNPAARLGPSPGFDELKWLKPVYAGDTISFESEVLAKRASRSMPEWGLVTIKNVGLNQNGEAAISFIGHVFVERRDRTAAENE